MYNRIPLRQGRAQLPSHLRYRLTKQDLVDVGFPGDMIWPGGFGWDCRVETRPSILQNGSSRELIVGRWVSRVSDGVWLVSAADGSGRILEVIDLHDLAAALEWV